MPNSKIAVLCCAMKFAVLQRTNSVILARHNIFGLKLLTVVMKFQHWGELVPLEHVRQKRSKTIQPINIFK